MSMVYNQNSFFSHNNMQKKMLEEHDDYQIPSDVYSVLMSFWTITVCWKIQIFDFFL